MKKQKLISLIAMFIGLSVATGCKNSTKPDSSATPNLPVVEETVEVEGKSANFVKTEKVKASLEQSLNELAEAKKKERELVSERRDVQVAMEEATTSASRIRLGDILSELNDDIVAAQTEVSVRQDLAMSKREILNIYLKTLSDDERADLGEAESEFGTTAERQEIKLDGVAAAYEAVSELIKRQEKVISDLDEKIEMSRLDLQRMEESNIGVSGALDWVREDINDYEKQRQEALKQLELLAASQEELSKPVSSPF